MHPHLPGPGESAPGFGHECLFYAGVEDYLAGTVPFVLDGLEAGDAVAVAAPTTNLALICDGLGIAAGGVHRLDMAEAGRNPGRIIGSVLARFAAEHPGRRLRIVSEAVWPGRNDAEYAACVQHEALVNLAFTGADLTVLCPYDTARLGPDALEDAARTHPLLVKDGHRSPSLEFEAPAAFLARRDVALPEPPEGTDVDMMVFDAAVGPRGVRRFVHEFAEVAGLPHDRIADLRAAVHELAVNTLVHTGRAGILSVWRAGGHLVCEVQDSGSITDPLAGRRPPEPFDGGSGLFLVHELSDLVRMHLSGPGCTVRVYFRLPDLP